MLTLLAALTLGSVTVDDVQVECRLIVDGEDRVAALAADCPDVADASEARALQAAADSVLARLGDYSSLEPEALPQALEMDRYNGRWDLAGIVQLQAPDYWNEGYDRRVSADCVGVIDIGADGRAGSARWACAVLNGRGREGRVARQVNRFRGVEERGAWLVPLRFEAGCAEATVAWQYSSSPSVEAVLPEGDRLTCDAFAYGAVHQAHSPVIPAMAAPGAHQADCEVTYAYDAAGFTRDLAAPCQVLDSAGAPLERDDTHRFDDLKAGFERSAFRVISRMRLEPSDEPFEGLRESRRRIDYRWDS